MITAERFVDLLAARNIVSSELIRGLRSRLAGSNQAIPAEPFVDRLVDRGVLSRTLADELLDFLRSESEFGRETDDLKLVSDEEEPAWMSSGTQPEPSPMDPNLKHQTSVPEQIPLIPPQPVAPPPVSLPPEQPPVHSQAPPAYTPSFDPPPPPLPESNSYDYSFPSSPPPPPSQPVFGERYERRQLPKNPWDSKLILYGTAGLFVLVFLSLMLIFSIMHRSADEILAKADQLYLQQSYTQAISEYEDFARRFPNHESTSKANVRVSLCRIFQATQGRRPDWNNGFEVVKAELPLIFEEPDFRKEAVPELSMILPQIASGLVKKANETSSRNHADRTGETLDMIARYLPERDRNSAVIRDIRISLDLCYQNLAADERLAETRTNIERILKNTPLSPEHIGEAYDVGAELLREYPAFRNDPRYISLSRSIASKESVAVRIEKDFPQPQSKIPGSENINEPIAVLAYRQLRKAAPELGDEVVFTVDSYGTLYGLKMIDGSILWRKKYYVPAPSLKAPILFALRNGDALLADRDGGRITRLNAKTGNLVYTLDLGEEFHMEPPVSRGNPSVAATNQMLHFVTENGRLVSMNAIEGKIVSCIKLPRETASAPSVDPVTGDAFQMADHSSMYFLPGKGGPPQSIYTGHRKGTVRVPPVRFGEFLLIVEQSGIKSTSELKVLRLKYPGSETMEETPPEDGNKTEKSDDGTLIAELVQSITFEGVLDSPPLIDGNQLYFASDTGQLLNYVLRPGTSDAPLQQVARSLLKEGTRISHDRRYLSVHDRKLWIADRSLVRADLLATQKRFALQPFGLEGGATIAPIRWINDTIVHVSREQGFNGQIVRAVSPGETEPLWEVSLGDPLNVEPFLTPNTNELMLHTSSGRMYLQPKTILETAETGTVRFLEEPKAAFARAPNANPLRDVVQLSNGYNAWITPPDSWSRSLEQRKRRTFDSQYQRIMLYDPDPGNTRGFRTIPLPASLASKPVAFEQGLLSPLENGQVALFGPKNAAAVADPFTTTLSKDTRTLWSEPLVPGEGSNNFLIIENPREKDAKAVLSLVALDTTSNRPILNEKARLELQQPVTRNMVAMDDRVFLIDSENMMHQVEINNLRTESEFPLEGLCTEGPFRIDDKLFIYANNRAEIVLLEKSSESETGFAITQTVIPFPFGTITGKPFGTGEKVYFLTDLGAVTELERSTREISELGKFEVPPSAGPVIVDRKLLYSARDGALYVLTIQ